MKKSVSDIIILFVTILQLIFPSYLLADNNNSNNVNVEFSTNFQDHKKDLGLLTKQEVLYFTYENGVRKEGVRESLLDVDLDHQRASILNPAQDLRYEYNSDTKELWIIFSQNNTKTKQKEDIKAHVIKDVELTSNVLVDANMIVFATTEGIRATLIDRVINCGFIEPILIPLISGSLSQDGVVISNIKSIGADEDLSKYIKDLDQRLYSGDFLLELESSSDGSKKLDYMVLDKSAVIMNLRTSLIGTLFLTSFYLDRKDQQDLVSEIESSLSEDKEEIDNFISSNESILNGSSGDLLTKALKNMAAGDKLKTILPLLKKSLNGRDALDTYANLDRMSFTVEDTQNIDSLIKSVEKQQGTNISDEKKLEIQKRYFQKRFQMNLYSLENSISETKDSTTWFQDLSDEILQSEASFNVATVKEKNVFKRMLQSTTNLWKSMSKGFKKTLATVSLGAVVATAYYNIDPAGAKVGLEYVSSLFKGLWDVINYTTNIPVISTLTEPIVGFINYVSQGWSAGVKVAIGLAGALSIYPLSLILVKLFKLASTKGQSLWQTFFDFGVRWYAKLCYPVVKFGWDALNQKNIYPALDIGMTPVFNGITDSKDKIREKASNKIEKYSNNQDLSFITKVLAASIVGGLSEIDVRALLLLESGSQMKEVASILRANSVVPTSLSALENIIYATLLETVNNEELVNDIDEKELEKYVQIYLDVKDRVEAGNLENAGFLKAAYQNFKKTISTQVVPYVLYGKQGLDFYNTYKNVVIDDNTASIAGVNYQNDYIFSTVMYAGAAAEKFVIGALGNIEVTANQLSQAFVFGLQGAVDPLTVSEQNFDGTESSLLNKGSKSQSFWETMKTMFSSSPTLSTIGYLDNHAQYIRNLFIGFNVRFLADYITRVPGLIITGIVSAGTLMSVSQMLDCAVRSIFLSTFFLIAKISVSTAFVGYAVVWPYVQLAMKKNRNSVSFNKDILDKVSTLIDQGIRFNDIEQVRKGVLGLKTIYIFAKQDIPEIFRKKVSEFSFDDAYGFYNYTMNNLPISTELNNAVDVALTVVIGSWISTVLFTGVSSAVYNPDLTTLDSLALLGESILFLGITYGSLKMVSWIIKNLFNKKVEDVLDENVLEGIDENQRLNLTREDVGKIFDRIRTSDCTDLFIK